MTTPLLALLFLVVSTVGCHSAGNDAQGTPAPDPAATPAASPPPFDHSQYDALLKARVDRQGRVDYAALARDRAGLLGYTRSLADVEFEGRGDDERLALLINAYNAFTLQLIVENYARGDSGPLKSIRDLKDPWDQKRWRLAGNTVSLNDIEHETIRKQFAEPRIHFALVCAAVGCPILRNEAYVPDRLEAQLDAQTRFVHAGPRWCRYDQQSNELHLTRLYDWYGGDFTKGGGTVTEYVAKYVPEVKKALEEGRRPKVRWLDYDWALNGR